MNKDKMNKLVLALLFAVCLGWFNAARGSGIGNMKFVELFMMAAIAWILTKNLWATVLYPFPIGAMFAIGTGELMPYFTPYMQWRMAEFLIGFGWTLAFFLPLWIREITNKEKL